LRRDAGNHGIRRRSAVLRPKKPVNMSGSPRALPCTEPSGSRMRGPAIAHCGLAAQLAFERGERPRRQPGIGIHDQHERRAGPRQRLVHGPAKADVGGVGDERDGGRELRAIAALPSCDALSTTKPSQPRPASSRASTPAPRAGRRRR
jgi:hypothetical protein